MGKLLTIFAMLFAVTCLTSCGSEMKKFPARSVYEMSKDGSVCGQYEIVDPERLLFKHIRDLPAKDCYGMFGFHRTEISPVLNWSRDAIEYGKKKCK